MILEPSIGLRVFFSDPDKVNPWSGWGTIRQVHGPRFVTLDMDDHTTVGAYTSELFPTPPNGKPTEAA